MTTSKDTVVPEAALAAALIAVQEAMPTVHKSKTAKVPTKAGSSYSYTYADLGAVSDAILPLLGANGLAWTCLPRQTPAGYELAGTLLHTSGARLEGALPIKGGTPQEYGSAITYARRYLLGCMTGIITDDDDDGAASSRAEEARREAAARPRANAQQLAAIRDVAADIDMDEATVLRGAMFRANRHLDELADLTPDEARLVYQSLVEVHNRQQQTRNEADDPHTDAVDNDPHGGPS